MQTYTYMYVYNGRYRAHTHSRAIIQEAAFQPSSVLRKAIKAVTEIQFHSLCFYLKIIYIHIYLQSILRAHVP